MTVPHNNHILEFIKFTLIGGGGKGVLVNLIAEQIISKQFTDIYWLTQIEHPLKISIRFLIKYSAQFVPGFDFINSQIPINWRNPQ